MKKKPYRPPVQIDIGSPGDDSPAWVPQDLTLRHRVVVVVNGMTVMDMDLRTLIHSAILVGRPETRLDLRMQAQ